MKKVFTLMMAMFMVISLTACGSSGRADDALVGKYIAVTGTAMGMTLSGEDMAGFTIELKSGGKATLIVEGTSADGKWINDDTTVTLTIDGIDMVGKLGKDTITFESILKELIGTSMDLQFAKEGTDAAKPENYLPEEEKALLGSWTGASVYDVLDKDASGEVSPDALKATLNSDHTATITYKDKVMDNLKWSYFSDLVSFEGNIEEGVSFYASYEKGVFKIDYSGADYYKFTMEKDSAGK